MIVMMVVYEKGSKNCHEILTILNFVIHEA